MRAFGLVTRHSSPNSCTQVRTACPPVPLRSLANGRRPCKCDKRSALMNCGEAQVNCSFARPERAVLWHHACRTGLYDRCINGSGAQAG